MPKFTVYLMKPVLAWEEVEADNETDAIAQCESGPDIDICADDQPMQFLAIEEEKEESAVAKALADKEEDDE